MRISAKLSIAAATIALITIAMFTGSHAFADTVDGVIEVMATDPCAVEIVGVSENTGGYETHGEVNGTATFTISLDEPGTYEYVLRQTAQNGMEIYDPTEYNVWVSAYYEGDSMQVMITGGIKGTDDKPDAFKFETPVKDPPKSEDDKKTEDNEKKDDHDGVKNYEAISETGDRTPFVVWGIVAAAGTALLVLTGALRIVSRRRGR